MILQILPGEMSLSVLHAYTRHVSPPRIAQGVVCLSWVFYPRVRANFVAGKSGKKPFFVINVRNKQKIDLVSSHALQQILIRIRRATRLQDSTIGMAARGQRFAQTFSGKQ